MRQKAGLSGLTAARKKDVLVGLVGTIFTTDDCRIAEYFARTVESIGKPDGKARRAKAFQVVLRTRIARGVGLDGPCFRGST